MSQQSRVATRVCACARLCAGVLDWYDDFSTRRSTERENHVDRNQLSLSDDPNSKLILNSISKIPLRSLILESLILNQNRDIAIGDTVTIGECRPLSKTVRFNVLKVAKAAGATKQFKKF